MLRNLSWNYIGRILVAAATYLSAPFLISIYGIEAYGVIALSMVMFVILVGIDFGITQTVNRYIAGALGSVDLRAESAKFISYLQMSYFLIVVVATLSLDAITHSALKYWIKPETDETFPDMFDTVYWMMQGVLLRWYAGLYRAILFGAERHEIANKVDVACVFSAFFLPVLLHPYISIDIVSFFKFQGFVWTIYFGCHMWFAQIQLKRLRLRFSFDFNGGTKVPLRYTLHVSLVAILTVCLANLDKVFVASALPLAEFATYSLCATLGYSIVLLTSPVITTMMPRAANYWLNGNFTAYKSLYYDFSRLIIIMSVPLGALLCFNSSYIMEIWVGSEGVNENTESLVIILALASLCSGLSYASNCVQLTAGRMEITLLLLSLSLAVFIISISFFYSEWGVLGIGFLWLLINLIYYVVSLIYTCLFITLDRTILGRLVGILAWVFLVVSVGIIFSYVAKYFLIMVLESDQASRPIFLFLSSFFVLITMFFSQKAWLKKFVWRYTYNLHSSEKS